MSHVNLFFLRPCKNNIIYIVAKWFRSHSTHLNIHRKPKVMWIILYDSRHVSHVNRITCVMAYGMREQAKVELKHRHLHHMISAVMYYSLSLHGIVLWNKSNHLYIKNLPKSELINLLFFVRKEQIWHPYFWDKIGMNCHGFCWWIFIDRKF